MLGGLRLWPRSRAGPIYLYWQQVQLMIFYIINTHSSFYFPSCGTRNLTFVVLCILFRGVHGSGLCPNRTRPELFGWRKMWSETDSKRWSDYSVRVSSGQFQVYHQGRNLARSDEIWLKSSRIRRDPNKIWPNLARSGRNPTWSVEIWPSFRQITVRSRRI